MLNNFFRPLFFPMVLLLPGCLNALGQRALTLEDCVKIALQQSLTIRSADNAFHSAQLAHQEVERTALPQLRVEGKALNAPNSEHFGYDPAVTDGGQFSAQLGVQELLYDGGARGLRANQLEVDIDRLHIEQRRAERDLKHTVTVAFLDFLQAQNEVVLERRRVEGLSDYLGIVNRLFRGGGVGYTDVLKTEVSFENAQLTLRKVIQSSTTAKFTLAEAMGSPHDTAFTVTGALEVPDSSSIDSLLSRTLVDSLHTLDLQVSQSMVQRTLFDVDIARTDRLPSISLTGDVGVLSSGDNLRLPAAQRTRAVGYSVGISVENLLFNWGVTDLRIQQRELDAENVQLTYEQQQRALIGEVRRLRTQIAGEIDQLRSIKRTLAVAEDNYTLTKAQYAGGGATALEVLSAEQLLADSRLVEIQTRADLRRLLAKADQLITQ